MKYWRTDCKHFFKLLKPLVASSRPETTRNKQIAPQSSYVTDRTSSEDNFFKTLLTQMFLASY